MKKLLFTIFAASLAISACTNSDQAEKARQDSIAEAAAADSMLNAAIAADTLNTDTLKADTLTTDSLKQ